jgi:hypothetical protein
MIRKGEPDWCKRSRRHVIWSWVGVAVALGALLGVLILNGRARGQPVCTASSAYRTQVIYVAAGDNTAVKMEAYCNGSSAEWYVSFFTGDQPTLWEWYEIQNAAGRLLYGD